MGFFDNLACRPMSVKELVDSRMLHAPAVEAWCSAAVAYRLIVKSAGGKLKLASGMEGLLIDKLDKDYLGGQFSYLALRSVEYGAFEQLFRSGKTKSISTSFDAIEEATHWDHYSLLRAIRNDKRLRKLLSDGCKFADIGCGTGSLIMKLCSEYPNSIYHGIDPSAVAVRTARQKLKGHPAIIERRKAEEIDFAREFDIVFLGESLYAADNKALSLVNCYRSLKEGGTVVILEGLIPETKVGQDDLLISGMQLDFALQGYKFMTMRELKGLLKNSGFKQARFMHLGGSVYLAFGTK